MEGQTYIEITESISIEEFRDMLKNQEFGVFWFSTEERAYFTQEKHANSLACRYLAKKIIKDRIQYSFSPGEINIPNNRNGKPVLIFKQDIDMMLHAAGFQKIHCSFSHSRTTSAAMVVFEKITVDKLHSTAH